MRKLYAFFVIAFLMPVFTFAADYCTPSLSSYYGSYGGALYTAGGYAQRYLYKLHVSDNNGSQTTVSGLVSAPLTSPNPGVAFDWCYKDQTGTILQTSAGSTITLNVEGADSWICQYFYIDFDNDGTFDVDQTKIEANGDLVSHNGYDPKGDPDWNGTENYMISSDGTKRYYKENVIDDFAYAGTMHQIPAYTLPANMQPGTYRARFKMQWNNTDPCGQCKDQEFLACLDFTIEVVDSRTVTVATSNADYGTVAIQGTDEMSVSTDNAVTVVATPAEGYTFMNWTNEAGDVVSTDATFTYTDAENAILTAHFGFLVTIERTTGGTVEVLDSDNNTIATGTILVPGTQLTINANANSGFHLYSIKVNGVETENGAIIEVNSAVAINVEFTDKFTVYINNANPDYGTVKICNDMNDDESPNGYMWENESLIALGESAFIFVIPAEGYEIATISIVGGDDEPFSYQNGDYLDEFTPAYVPAFNSNALYYCPPCIVADLVVSVSFAVKTAAIEGIDADNANAPVEYFNLQGMRVNADNLTPGVYVTRQGSKTAKVLIK